MHGNLNYAAEVAPFGRPFLAHLTNAISAANQDGFVRVTEIMRMGLRIWLRILLHNRGVSFDFVLGKLPRCSHDIFVDASTEWGIGGCYGREFFLYPWRDLMDFGADFIARKELLAGLVAVFTFRKRIEGRLVNLFSDNSSAVQWLKKSRTSNLVGNTYLAC